MSQETATSVTMPDGPIWQAWLDPILHPRFTTFQRWFPLMQTRWRGISLTVSLVLILVTTAASLALYAFVAPRTQEMLSLPVYFAYLRSPHGIVRAVFDVTSSLALIFAIPALVTLISPRSLGPYRIRFKRIFRPWMQVQPAICGLLLCTVLAEFILNFSPPPSFISSSWFGHFPLTSDIVAMVSFVLVAGPALYTWTLTCEALAAGSSRTTSQAGLVAAIPGFLVYFLPVMLGHPLL